MKCPKCGAEIDNGSKCEKCGWINDESLADQSKNAVNNTQQENVDKADSIDSDTDFNSLENIKVDFDEVDGTVSESEDEMNTSPEDLVIDFDEIDNNVHFESKKSNSWLVAAVSFVAGVLATLITVGCFNGTIMSYFDRLTNGTPYETIEEFCEANFESFDENDFTKSISPYYRAQVVALIKNYVDQGALKTDVNLDVDVTKDDDFKKIAKVYFDNFGKNQNTKMNLNNIKFNGVEYYKSGSDEFNSYLDEYKQISDENVAKAKGISLFAKVTCNIAYTVDTLPEATTVPETTTEKTTKKADAKNKTKKAEKSKTTEQTTSVSQTTTTVSETTTKKQTYDVPCTIVCVKINDSWYVYNGISTDESAS